MKKLSVIKRYRNILVLLPQLPKIGRLCWRLGRDRRVPKYLKAMVIAAILYVLSPVDLIPEFLMPLIGHLDDATLLLLAGYYFIHWSPPEVVAEHMAAIGGDVLGRRRPWSLRSVW